LIRPENEIVQGRAFCQRKNPGFDANKITEDVRHSFYKIPAQATKPSEGVTDPEAGKSGAYSWLQGPKV